MDSGKEIEPKTKCRRVPRWVKVVTGLVLFWTVLNTRINLNPPLESLADPNVDIESALVAVEGGDTSAAVPVYLQGIAEQAPDAHRFLADFYAKGYAPFHADPCSAFDHYLVAAQMGDEEAQLMVGQLLVKEHDNEDRKDSILVLKWHLYSRKIWIGQAYIKIYKDFVSMSEADRVRLVERTAPDLLPTDAWSHYPSSSYRMPVIPLIWRLIRYIVPTRACQDPTVLDHLRRVLG